MASPSIAPALPPAIAAGSRIAVAGVLVAGIVSAGLIWAALGDVPFTAIFLAMFVAAGIALPLMRRGGAAARPQPVIDWSLLSAALEDSTDAVAVTDRDGELLCANSVYEALFGGLPAPAALPFADDGADRLAEAGRIAWRDGDAGVAGLEMATCGLNLRVRRAGLGGAYLVWRFDRAPGRDPLLDSLGMVEGEVGRRLEAAGVMAALVDHDGRVMGANRVFRLRALGDPEQDVTAYAFPDLLRSGEDDLIRLAREPDDADPIRIVPVAVDQADPTGAALFLMLDEDGASALRPGARSTATANVHALLAMLPLGLALAERDGRFLFMNAAFGRAAGLATGEGVLYPSDLVVEEDKATVAEAVRRFAAGRALPGDLAVRLKHRPDEPVVLTIAGAKGLGDAAALLSLKDNSEESKLKRQIAQATKMQAVGQLAGGVAHDFNNILTAIIGHCDLMLMRHTPGDIDYDDIQQIKHNSNRAASLTRQLLAFSRQQTLRPQILQLPDVISEISNLLKRLLGETVTLTVKHGRNLGFVRADPGQLEQVIVNLAVNARDAMPGGGTLALQTYAVSAADVRKLGSEIMPVVDYTALSVSDTGTGIPPEIIGKIFEPFFTTKEVGKGTGLGLSTVYGIVKQTGGFIFAESEPGQGTRFLLYLPVHQAEKATAEPVAPARIEAAGETWGTGTILLVEDEAMVRGVAERALVRQGYRVLIATNGEEALDLLEGGEAVDLLISDVVMPTMDGPTLVRHARGRFPDMPILFMSGYAEEQLRRSIDIDRIAFLPKPFSVQQLAAAARDVMAAAKNHGG
ncbi:hybrid sensor histidine kinase/response regulator [Sphingomonas oleivorans]|uniref:histidine kinase n=1 Tax=Sphingomonas oleivorans TaxID=1735121 RepID=A0A2T5FYK2_9SPHN|nr:ATP-binding protein [Sphingomonas oleivorans]PTQ11601.1 hybrid sensor histidine kinase/response regulator [Sphingomonas oleivorans]